MASLTALISLYSVYMCEVHGGLPCGIHGMSSEKAALTCCIALKMVFNNLPWIPIRSYSHLSPHQWPSSPSMTISSNLLHQSSFFNILYQMTTTNLQPPSCPSKVTTTSFISISCDQRRFIFLIFLSLLCFLLLLSFCSLGVILAKLLALFFHDRNVMVNGKSMTPRITMN